MVTFLLTLAFAAAVVTILVGVVVLLGNLLPTAAITTAIAAASGYFSMIHSFLPLTTVSLLAILGALFSIEVLVITPYKMAKWVWKKIPGIS
jgi:hypothetical protein